LRCICTAHLNENIRVNSKLSMIHILVIIHNCRVA